MDYLIAQNCGIPADTVLFGSCFLSVVSVEIPKYLGSSLEGVECRNKPGAKHRMLLPGTNYALGTASRRTPSRISTPPTDLPPLAAGSGASPFPLLRTRRVGTTTRDCAVFRYS